ncbi:MAG: twin-arginine translocation signal domain-containing protein, partial [Pirellula sp.]
MSSTPIKPIEQTSPQNNLDPTDTSRRSFITKTASVSAMAGASSFLARSAHAAGSDIIKVGLVGCGGRGFGAAKNAMTADAGCRLTAIAEVFYDRMIAGKAELEKTLG